MLIDNFKLVEARSPARAGDARRCWARGAYPARNPTQNIADLQAQIAANEKGVQELRAMVAHFGLDVVQAYMRHVQDNAEESVRRVITRAQGRRASRCRSTTARGSRSRSGSTPRARSAEHRLHRHLGAAAEQLQRADGGLHGGGAVRVPHAGRRRHPAQRRLPEAAQRDRSPRARCCNPRYRRRRWWRATSRPRPASPTRSTARSA